ncbi:family 1 glycosylhydrolase [Stygiolobus caldivivus]|uniref:Beta-galactosidase n=1 Tax=Stygiolobus caldivivus TaxID=2824673 RepID=A0A8D5U8X6_9CREN|nr:family 1 glycosylhydrolase [Stygiolobus caldivivus]BCU71063.1 beta-galactosidase [Stygiolobus caldivivus]
MKFGFSTSAFQFEETNTNSDWYEWLKDEVNITSGKVVPYLPYMNYYLTRYMKIHEIAEKLNASIWRFNPSWARLFKDSKRVDDDAVKKYREILKDLKNRGFTVILCLNHFDLPLWVHQPIIARDFLLSKGKLGWYTEDTVKEFLSFSKFVVDNFSEYVDLWCTFNEPNILANFSYLTGIFPPGITSKNAFQKALTNIVTAHNLVYEELKGLKVGIIYNFPYVQGSKEMEENIAYSFLEKVKFDWIGVNYYSRIVYDENGSPKKGYGIFCQPNSVSLEGNPTSDYGWEVYPKGLEEVLKAVNNRFNKPIYVTENGIADSRDFLRPNFLAQHLEAIKNSGIKVEAYLHWSIIDNFEWNFGYEMKFGLYTLDLKPRPSSYLFKEFTEVYSNA